jgi:hypothetical protein
MKQRALILAIIASTVLTGWGREKLGNWVNYVSPTSRFKARFPAKPLVTKQTDSSPVGEIVTVVTRANWGVCTVSCSDLPPMASLLGPERLFEDTRDSILKDVGGTETAWTDIARFGEGKQLSYKAPNAVGTCQIYFLKNRLYVADVRTAKPEPTQAQQFLSNWAVQR